MTATKGAPSGVTQFLAGTGYIVLPAEPRNWRLVRALTISAAFPVAALLAGYYGHLLSGEPDRITTTWGGVTIAGIVLAIACVFAGSITALKWALEWRTVARGWQGAFERTMGAYRQYMDEPHPWNGRAHKVALTALAYIRAVDTTGAALSGAEEEAMEDLRRAVLAYADEYRPDEDEEDDETSDEDL
jgi:hypothetical protein